VTWCPRASSTRPRSSGPLCRTQASIAGLLMTTEAMVAEKPKEGIAHARHAARRRHGLLVERFQSSNRRIRGMESQRCNCEVSWNRSSSCINKRKARTNAPGLVISHRIAEYAASSLLSRCWRSASLVGSVCRAFCSHFIMRTSAWSGSLLMLSLYNFIICVVAAALYVVVNELEPNRRLASALRIVIVAVAVAAILGHLRR